MPVPFWFPPSRLPRVWVFVRWIFRTFSPEAALPGNFRSSFKGGGGVDFVRFLWCMLRRVVFPWGRLKTICTVRVGP